jgi:hypothetical protein
VLWPPGVLITVWALHRGERWPLFAPVAFVAGLGVVLAPVAAGAVDTLGAVTARLAAPFGGGGVTAGQVGVVAVEAAEQLGVVGLLLASVGLAVLVVRAPFVGTLAVLPSAVGLMAASAAPGTEAAGTGSALALLGLAAPLGIGVVFLSNRLGFARLPAALVLGVTALVVPALDGGAARWTRDTRLPARLLEEAHARSPLRATVDPGSAEMRALLRYGAALGLRPDLTLRP